MLGSAGVLSRGPATRRDDLVTRGFDDPGPSLTDIGEAGLLGMLLEAASAPPSMPGLLVGPGDDAAAWMVPEGAALVQSQDALVEGVDFRRGWTSPYRLGRRALHVALSDLAAMGAEPRSCLATVCAPATTRLDDVLAIQLGILDAGSEVGCALLGGDLSATAGPLVIDIGVTGIAPADRLMRRDAGRAGHALAVTGTLGRAAAGLRVLTGESHEGPPAWVAAQLDPRARLAEGRAFAAAGVRCAGDISDGLAVDAARIAGASRCAVEIWLDRLPVDAELRQHFADWADLATAGGEDFELVLAAPPALVAALPGVTVVGRLLEGSGVRILDRQGGDAVAAPDVRSRHFA